MKKLLFVLLSLLFVIIAAIISIPYLLNSSTGKKMALSKISRNSNYSLEAERLCFSWTGPQRAENLTAISSQGVRYDFPELSLKLPLWKLWKKNPSIGITRISNLIVTVPPIREKPPILDKPDSMIPNIKCPPLGRCAVFGEIHVTDGLLYIGRIENPITIPKLQYVCAPDRIALHIDAKFPNAMDISHMDMECTASSQDFQIKGRDIPTYLFDEIKNSSSKFSLREIIGPVFDIEANAKLSNSLGPVFLNMHSPNLSITQSGELYSDHYVLDKPLTLSLQLSKEALNSVFHHPILQIDRIDQPIRVNIPPQEIPLPLSSSTEINNASIHIGTITCINKDLLFHIAAELLHIDDSKIDIWFSEIPVHYGNGILQISRSEIVVQNKYQLAIWGKIDCFQKKVRLKLGIPESTLRKVFGIKSLPPNCMITCTIKGNFDDIQLDTSKLVKKIAILMAKDKAKKQVWKEGSNFFKDSTDIPQPIKSLPWDNK